MSEQEPVIIKRYANRKLYNTNQSCYITLEQIADMIKDGIDVRIVDYKSHKDITSVTMAQIIFEKEKRQRLLPSQTLKYIIQSGGEAISDFFLKKVNLGQLKEEAEKTVEVFEKLFSKGVFTKEDSAKVIGELVRTSQNNLEDLQKRIDDRIKTIVGPVAHLNLIRKEVDSLQAQVELLEEKLKNFEDLAGVQSEEMDNSNTQ